ncbi:hypothetical protein AN640_08130 [Candidatus Epulonipiscium fishelsonii]|uniref:Uncharacterized protein n=1 Tax=Candidatus Epulonipiscium fishelsonii TaxID=77094 RepID=A0ACC8XEH6_9FIRM|nr:hypothetical protein AN640_08130 [Epulopiscium sp. SCG-D08WGA-EpuloA1]OON95629.1 MAG: hypothetical protein ATN32_07005 [Epulopiscium sp. AS2M-Bin002]
MTISIHMTDDYVLKRTFNQVKKNMSNAKDKAKKVLVATSSVILVATVATSSMYSDHDIIYIYPEKAVVIYQEEYEYRTGRKKAKQEQRPF